MPVEVLPVATRGDRDRFLRLPWRLYRNEPAWVPNLLLLQREVIDPKKNPFFEHGEAQLFLALRDGRPAGRISAQIDRHHNEFQGEKTGLFGFFDAEDDEDVAAALFGAAEAWLRDRGMERIRGPFNLSVNQDYTGLLVEGFEHAPMVGMTHALPYYARLVESSGLTKAMDLYAYRWDITEPPARMMAAVERARSVPGLEVRNVALSHLKRDVNILLDIFNDAWKDNWGYVPVTPKEALKMASDLRLVVDPNIGLIAEINGEPAGMILGIPNLFEAIRDFRGFLNPWNAVRLVWRLKVRKVETARVLLFGVKRKYGTRKLVGLPYLLLYELYRGSHKGRYKWGEMSWVLETNGPLNAMIPYWGAYVYKRYRLYEKAL